MIQFFLLLALYLVAGFVIGIFTERLASRRVSIVSVSWAWPTLVKYSISFFVWKYLIFSRWQNNDVGMCSLPSTRLWLNFEDIPICTGSLDGIKLSFIVMLRCACFCAGAFFGAALQPIGLTGGIACGKSTVARLLREPLRGSRSGYGLNKKKKDALAIVDLDVIAHDILVPGKMGSDCGYTRVVDAFHGSDIFVEESDKNNPSSSSSSSSDRYNPLIDRRKLGDIIFRDAKKRRALNAITHPLISKVMLKQVIREKISPSSDKTSAVAVDIPLLFEVGLVMRMLFAIKIVVACDEKVQLKRLAERNKDLSQEQCEHRIKSQMPISKKVEMADIVIWNNGSMDDLVMEVEKAREVVMDRSHALFGVTVASAIAFAGMLTVAACSHDVIKLIATNSMLLQCAIGGDC